MSDHTMVTHGPAPRGWRLLAAAVLLVSPPAVAASPPHARSNVFVVDTRLVTRASEACSANFTVDNRALDGMRAFAESGVSGLDTGGNAGFPIVEGITPAIVPGLDARQWITVTGRNFADGARVILRVGGSVYSIPAERTERVSASAIRVYVNVTSEPAEWTAQVINPDGSGSALLSFGVNPPLVRPLAGADFGTLEPGQTAERTFTVRNTGTAGVVVTVSVGGPFMIVNGPFPPLAPGAEQAVIVRYAPAVVGRDERTAVFQVGGHSATRGLSGRTTAGSLTATGTVEGTVSVQGPDGPVAVGDSLVMLFRESGGKREQTGHSGRTGSRGEFALRNVSPGPCLLVAFPPARKYLAEQIVPLTVTAGNTERRAIILPPAEGHGISDPANVPVILVRGRGKEGDNESGYWMELRNRLRPSFHNVWDPNESGEVVISGEDGIKVNATALHGYILAKAAGYQITHGTPPAAVNLVTHSMGGLIVRQLLHDNTRESDPSKRLPPVREVFMLATPNAGTVLADAGQPLAFWQYDWQTNKDLKTNFVRNVWKPKWPEAGRPRLFVAGGTVAAGDGDLVAGSLWIKFNSPPADWANDGAVTLLSTRGNYYPAAPGWTSIDLGLGLKAYQFARSLLPPATSFGDANFSLEPQAVAANHYRIHKDPAVMEWICHILAGGHPRAIGASAGGSPLPAPRRVPPEEMPPPPEADPAFPSTAVDFHVATVPAGQSLVRTIPLDSTARAGFVVSCSDSAVVVRLVTQAGAVVDAQSAAGDPAIDFETSSDVSGASTVVTITEPAAGPWQVIADGSAAAADFKVSLQASCVSDFRILSDQPAQAGRGAPVPVTALLAFDSADAPSVAPGATVSVIVTAPDGTATEHALADNGTSGDGAAGDGLHGWVADGFAQPGDYQLLYRAEGPHPVSGENFRRVVRSGLGVSAPGGFIAAILSHLPVDADDNGYLDSVVLEVRVEAAAAGNFTLSGLLTDEDAGVSVSAATDFTRTAAGSGVVTLVFTPRELPQGTEFGPFEVTGLRLVRHAAQDELLDTFSGSHTVDVTLYNEISRRIRLTGDLAFGGVRIGASATRDLLIHNDGWETLSIARLQLPAGFSAAFEGRVEPGEAAEVAVTFTPVAETAYAGSLVAESDAPSGEPQITLSATGLAEAIPLDTWLANGGLEPEVSGPMDDPNGDGVPNLLAYLFNIEPRLTPPAASQVAAPVAHIGGEGDQRFIALTYRHNKHAVGLEVVLESSDSLLPDSWLAITPDDAIDIGKDPVTGDSIRQLRVTISDQFQRFLRLRVVRH